MAWIEEVLQLGEGQGLDYMKLARRSGVTGGDKSGILTWEGVHLAMAGLSPIEKAILYLKYNPPRARAHEIASLTTRLWMALEAIEARNRPKPMIDPTPAEKALMDRAQANRDIRQARTVQTVLTEYMDTKLCDRCRGSREPGKVGTSHPVVGVIYETCDKCQGRTWLPWSDNKRAQGCGGDRNLWKTRYERNYLTLLDECSTIYREGTKLLKERLFGPAPVEAKMQARA